MFVLAVESSSWLWKHTDNLLVVFPPGFVQERQHFCRGGFIREFRVAFGVSCTVFLDVVVQSFKRDMNSELGVSLARVSCLGCGFHIICGLQLVFLLL